MASLEKTEVLNLNVWNGSDYINRIDFNQDNLKLDSFAKSTNNKINDIKINVENILSKNLEGITDKVNNTNINLLDLAIEVETLKNASLTGVDSNIIIETFQNMNDINILSGKYDNEKKCIKLNDNFYIKSFGFSFN